MTEKDAQSPRPAAPARETNSDTTSDTPRNTGRERLAAALRENLHRRKAQARARRAAPAGEPSCRTSDTDVEKR